MGSKSSVSAEIQPEVKFPIFPIFGKIFTKGNLPRLSFPFYNTIVHKRMKTCAKNLSPKIIFKDFTIIKTSKIGI